VQALRLTGRRDYARRAITARQHGVRSTLAHNEDPWVRLQRLQRERTQQLIQPVRILESAFLLRNIATFFAGIIAAGGAYWALNQDDFNRTALAKAPTQPLTTLGNNLVHPERAAATGISQAFSVEPDTAETTRRALVVANGQFYAGDIVGDEPISKEVDASGRLVVEMLTPEQATAKLRQNEQSYLIGRGAGVVRYDVTQLASNNPIEDDHAERIVPYNGTVAGDADSKSDWMFWGVFDGHSGWTTSAKLRQALISFVTRELNTTYSSSNSLPTPEAIDAAIKNGFNKLDYEIVHESVNKLRKDGSKVKSAELLSPALSGSCALLSFYDSQSKTLRVACTGDSRAVLGRRSNSGKWVATALSEDFTGGTPSEDARLRREHPGEPYVTHNGRILGGLEPSRAFGDAVYKWSLETQRELKSKFFGRTPSPQLKTPPYVTAEPVVTTTKIMPEKGDFVVMATDGLWECLTNEEVVGLVGQWIEQNSGTASKGLFSSFFGNSTGLPVENHSAAKKSNQDGQRAPVRQQQYQITAGDERFVVEDKNAASHLVRNALGGKDRDMFTALLTLPAPFSRRYRDDLTVEVIFFGEGGKGGGDVVQNQEASNMNAGAKPKL